MKFSCKQKDFVASLQNVQRAIQSNNTLPVLNNVLIKAEENKITLIGTNLEIAIQSSFEANIEREGTFTVPVKILSAYISLLSEKDIEISLEADANISIKQGISETKIKGISADEFPLIPKIEKENELSIKAEEFKKMTSQVVFSASTNQSRPALMGVLFCVNSDSIKQVATDSYRLSERQLKMKTGIEQEIKIIVPARTLSELSKIISGESDVKIIFAKNQIVFEWENFSLISRLIEGVFPNYESIIPKSSTVNVEISKDLLIIALKKLTIFAVEKNGSIYMSVTNDGFLHLFTEKGQMGECKEAIEAVVNGQNTKVSLNVNYLMDILQNIYSDKVQIEMGEKFTPILIKPLMSSDYLNIIMPLI